MSDNKSFQISGYMTIEASKDYYGRYSGRIKSFTKGKPSLNNRQIAVYVRVNVPVAFFERMTPVFEIDIPTEAVAEPTVESVVKLTSLEVADKLQIDALDIEDGLKQIIELHKKKVAEGHRE